jgi:pyruvate formate lyase activating enzyme
VLSLGTIGCNLGCRFCQNSQISRAHDIDMLPLLLSPEEIAALAVEHQCKSVAFTYNDPIPSFEYYIDIAQCCMKRGINMIAVTAGYIDRIAREPFFSCTQAANIDLKCFSENFYKQLCSAHLQPVLETLEYVANHTSVWLEISVLLIPGKNDSKSELTQMCQWLTHHIGYDVPLTFSAYHPTSTFQEAPSTPADTILRAREIALKAGVKFVYSGNIQHPESSTTFCPHCSAPVIRRHGWHTERCGISHEGICLSCQTPIPGRFAF